MNKDLRNILEAIEQAGYVVVISKKGHPQIHTQDGTWITSFSGTASDWRSNLNALAPLRRRGFRWPPKR